jgi:hypothetical protein
VGRVELPRGQLRTHRDVAAAGGRPGRRGVAGLADHRPGGGRDGLRRGVPLFVVGGGLCRDPALLQSGHRLRPARHRLPTAARGAGAVAQPARRPDRPQPDPVPQQRHQPTRADQPGRRSAPAALRHRERPGGLLPASAPTAGRAARRRLPGGAQHRPAAAP